MPARPAPRIVLRRRPRGWARWRGDVLALGVFLALFVLAMWHRFTYDNWLFDYDILTFFLPWYGVLGDRLRGFDIPGWTRYFSAGAPLAGDPSAGWMYGPVMVAFTLATGATAFKLMVAIQVLIGGFATYALGRLLGFRPPAALLSTIAFALGPFLYGQTAFTTVAAQVATWIPVGMVAIELALRSGRWRVRVAWWSLAGLAIAQMAVAWPGQGMINGMLIIAAWIAYRAVLWPVDGATPWRARLVAMVTTGVGVLVLGLLLGAAGLLPRFAVNEQSSIAGGDYSDVIGGNYESAFHDMFRYVRETLSDEILFRPLSISGGLVVVALLAPLLARTRHAVPFFVGIYAVAAILAFPETFVHRIFYLIPQFETMHEHGPRRFLWMVSLCPAMLGGATLQSLLDRRPRAGVIPFLVVPLAVVIGARVYLLDQARGVEQIGPWLVGAALAATVLVLLASFATVDELHHHGLELGRIATVGLIALVFLAPTGRDIMHTLYDPAAVLDSWKVPVDPSRRLHSDPETQRRLDRYTATSDPNTAAAFLQGRRDAGELFRYVGYASRFYPDPVIDDMSYSSRRYWTDVIAILVSGRAGTLQIDGIQVYNPTHLADYAAYIDTMNGGQQDYHWLDPYPSALAGSPLLDMLNVRYILVATSVQPPNRPDALAIAAGRPIVYQDAEVTVYENVTAYDRAWIVHDVRSDTDGAGLMQIANGSVDGRQVAFVDGEPPPVAAPDPAMGPETVTVTQYEDDALKASVNAASPGFAVFSEVYADGWQAWVDGEEVDIVRTNGALRGVPVPPGAHTIEMRYDPVELRAGLWVTGVTGLAAIGLAGWNGIAALRGAPAVPPPGLMTRPERVPDPRRRRGAPRARPRRVGYRPPRSPAPLAAGHADA